MLGLTPTELAITGPHLVGHTIDGPVIVTHVDHYHHREDTGVWYALIAYRTAGNVTAHTPVPVERMEVRP